MERVTLSKHKKMNTEVFYNIGVEKALSERHKTKKSRKKVEYINFNICMIEDILNKVKDK